MEMHQHSSLWAEIEETQHDIQAEWSEAERRERQSRAARRQLGLLWLLSRRPPKRHVGRLDCAWSPGQEC